MLFVIFSSANLETLKSHINVHQIWIKMFIGRRVLRALNQVSQRLAIASQVPLSPQKWTQHSSSSKLSAVWLSRFSLAAIKWNPRTLYRLRPRPVIPFCPQRNTEHVADSSVPLKYSTNLCWNESAAHDPRTWPFETIPAPSSNVDDHTMSVLGERYRPLSRRIRRLKWELVIGRQTGIMS